MKKELTPEQVKEMLSQLGEAIKDGPWEDSNFLRMIGVNLKNIHQKIDALINSSGQNVAKIDSTIANRVALRSGQIEIYIGLYCTDGLNIIAWERVVGHLPNQIISRPIYADEEDIKAIIRTKEKPHNEAYVKAYISQDDILNLPEERMPLDKRGKPLITLKDKTLTLSSITRFIHQSGTYDFLEGRLVKQSN